MTHDRRSRRDPGAKCSAAADDSRSAVSAEPRVGRHLHHRRQSLDQCRRRACAALRHDARSGAGAGGGAGRRARAAICCGPCARTIPATISSSFSSAPKARSASSPRRRCKLFPEPGETRDGVSRPCPRPPPLCSCWRALQAATGGLLSAFELMPRIGAGVGAGAHSRHARSARARPRPGMC